MAAPQDKKVMMLKIGTAAATVVILLLWLVNLWHFWRTDSPRPPRQELTALREDLSRTLEGVQGQLEKMSAEREEARGSEFVESLKDEIARPRSEEEAPAAPPSPEDDMTAAPTSTPAAPSFCPAFINCMPTYDAEPRPCVVPPGCEGETIIAY